MKKHFMALIILLALAISGIAAIPACAASDTLVLPQSLEVIQDEAFEGAASLEYVYLREGIKAIGSRAFADTSVYYISLPYSLEYIAPDAFEGADPIFDFPEDSYAEEWFEENYGGGDDDVSEEQFSYTVNSDGTATLTAFTGTSSVVSVPGDIDGRTVSAIGDGFMQDSGVETVYLPQSMRTIGADAFRNCAKLDYIYLPGMVESIGDYAFSGCEKLASLIFPDSLTSIGAGAFSESGITRASIPMSVTSLPERAFYNCASLSSVNLPQLLTDIGDSCFEGCAALENIALHENLQTIGSRAFANCSLEWIDLPYSLTHIASDAFEGTDCEFLYVSGSYAESWYQMLHFAYEEAALEDLSYTLNEDGTAAITGYDGKSWGVILPAEIEGHKVTAIGEYAFAWSEIIGIRLPETITRIEMNGFHSCENLREINFPEGLAEIGELAFNGCDSLQTIHLPDSLVKMGTYVFFSCTALREVAYPRNLAEGGDYMFSQTAIEEIIIPEGVTRIPDGTFSQCAKLKKITIPDSVTDIGYNCFSFCTTLETIDLPKGLTSLERRTFAFCSALKSVVIPENVSAIGAEAFADCTSLISVDLPEGLAVLGEDWWNDDGIFENCTSLAGIDLPGSLTEIGPRTFYNCDSLQEVIIPDSVLALYGACFGGCDNLKKVYVPAGTRFENYPHAYHIFMDSPNVEVHTEYGATLLSYLASNDVPYFYLTLVDQGLNYKTYYETDSSTYLGRVYSTDPITRVETQVLDSSGNIVYSNISADGETNVATLSVNLSHLKLGNYRYKVHGWADNSGVEEYRLLMDSEFSIIPPPLRVRLSEEFVPPEVVHGLGFPYQPEGHLISNNYIEWIQVSMTNTETGDIRYSPLYEPGTKTFSMAELHSQFDFASLVEGEYIYRIKAGFEKTDRLVYTQNILVTEYDGVIDAEMAKKILDFCDINNNPTGIFDPFEDFRDVLDGISDLDACLMAMPAGNDWLVSNIVGTFTGVEGDAFIVNLYKTEILNMLKEMDKDTVLITADADISIAKNLITAFKLSGNYHLSGLKENFRYAKTLYKYAVKKEYQEMLAGVSEAEIDKLVADDLMYMSEYIKDLEDGFDALSKVAKGGELTLDALEILAMSMNDYQNKLAILDSLKKAYVGKLPTEFSYAIDLIKAEYQSAVSVIVTETFQKIGEAVVEKGIDLASEAFVHVLTGFSSSGGFTLACAQFAVKLFYDWSGLDDFSDNHLAFVTQCNLVWQNREAFRQAVYAVQDGDQSSETLQNVYVSFIATRTSLLSVYTNMSTNGLHDDTGYIIDQCDRIRKLDI